MNDISSFLNDTEQELHRQNLDISLSNDSLLQAPSRPSDTPPVDLEIQSSFDELRRLKFQFVELRTKEIFLKRILETKSLEDLPSSNEAGRAEVALAESKRELREIKASRRQAEERERDILVEIGKAFRENKASYENVQKRISDVRAAVRSNDAEKVLSERDIDSIQSLLKHIDELDEHCCRDIVQVLQEEKRVIEREAKEKSTHVDSLRKKVRDMQNEVDSLEHETTKLKEEIAKNDNGDSGAATLRREYALLNEMDAVLAALGGVHVSEVRANGMSFEFNAALFMPFVEGRNREISTHLLDVEFAEEDIGNVRIANMAISPPDINVTDLCDDNISSLPMSIQIVGCRLAAYMEGRKPT